MKLQLFVVLIILGCVPMSIFSNIICNRYEQKAIDVRVSNLQRRITQLGDKIVTSNFIFDEDNQTIRTELQLMAEQYDGRLVIVNSNYKVRSDTYKIEPAKSGSPETGNVYNISEEVISALAGTPSSNVVGDMVQLAYPIQTAASTDSTAANKNTMKDNQGKSNIVGAILLTASIRDVESTVNAMEEKTFLIIMLVILLVCLFSAWYSNVLVKPFKRVSQSIDHISEGSFEERITIDGYTEVINMAESVNKMINRVEQLESSRQEFVSNVSHELKTPITSIKVLADSLLAQEGAPAELYREFMSDITEEIERENKIINDLLSLVKLDKTSGEMNITSVNINELLELILKRLRPIASTRNIELIFESFRPVIAEVDEVKLTLAISNLIENAIKYNFDDGWVRISLNADHKFFYVKVSDSGVGIPEDVQDHIFERFYRVDKARSRETGGTGLGLSITRNAILMHRGAIKVYSKEKEGTTFTVRVPLNYIA
ncbi:MAG: HAMP domain-containing sensor histidine kinase [bacterium]|nr:HAMP domain-containing sensor histidine kinase [bacterium]